MEEFRRDETYRIFVTESLRLAPQAKISKPYREFVNPKKIDTRSGDQIVIDTMKKAGLKFREG